MSTQQVTLMVGAFILMGILLLPIKRMTIYRDEMLISSEATTTATALGQELLEEISVRKFDEFKSGKGESTNVATDFSVSPGLESADGDTAGKLNTYDDLDDFNGYARIVSTPRIGAFTDSCKVYYVSENYPDVVSGSRTFLKRIDVRVRNPYILSKDSTVTVSKIMTYRYRGGN